MKTNTESGKELLNYMRKHGLDDYGSIFPRKKVHEIAGISVPEIGTMKEFTTISLLELNIVDYVRKVLLNEGKYITQSKDTYRILTPSENLAQVHSYNVSAMNKMKRGNKLLQNTIDLDNDDMVEKNRMLVANLHKMNAIKNEKEKAEYLN